MVATTTSFCNSTVKIQSKVGILHIKTNVMKTKTAAENQQKYLLRKGNFLLGVSPYASWRRKNICGPEEGLILC